MSTTVCQSNVPTLQRKVAVPHAQSMATERRKRGTRTPRPKHDTRVAELVDQVKRLMERNGVSGLQLLVGAETVLFDEGRHRILGLVESRIERV